MIYKDYTLAVLKYNHISMILDDLHDCTLDQLMYNQYSNIQSSYIRIYNHQKTYDNHVSIPTYSVDDRLESVFFKETLCIQTNIVVFFRRREAPRFFMFLFKKWAKTFFK